MKTAPYLKDIDVFSELNSGDLRQAKTLKVCRNMSKGEEVIDSQNCQNRVFIVEDGQVRLYQLSEDGREQTLDILPRGAIFGDLSLESQADLICVFAGAEVDNTNVCIMSKSDFFDILTSRPNLAIKIISDLATRLSVAGEKIATLALADAKVRLLSELVRLGRSFGVEEEETIRLTKKFTHEQLANLIGTTRETVTKAIKEINRDCNGCITQSKDHHFILDKSKVLEVIHSV